jgi:uncharacterized BrkB/YihY/UPF0761 family membrane protein
MSEYEQFTADPGSPVSAGATPQARDGAERDLAGTVERPARGLRRRVGGGVVWAKSERDRAEEALRARRERSTIIDAGFEIQELDLHVGGGILAGAVAFRMFLFFVPFVYVVFTIFDAAAKAASDNPSEAAKAIGITGVLASALVSTSDLNPWSHLALALGAGVALVITANNLVKTFYVVHWLIWRIPRVKPRGYRPIAVVVGIALALAVISVVADALRRTGFLGRVAAVTLILGVAFLLWWWVSYYLPHAPTSWRALVPGAVFVAIGVELLAALTSFWFGPLVARKSHTYGAVGIALAVLLWVYILGRVMVGAAGVNATLWRRSAEGRSSRSSAPYGNATRDEPTGP